jgi:hypothetical protein
LEPHSLIGKRDHARQPALLRVFDVQGGQLAAPHYNVLLVIELIAYASTATASADGGEMILDGAVLIVRLLLAGVFFVAALTKMTDGWKHRTSADGLCVPSSAGPALAPSEGGTWQRRQDQSSGGR